MLVAPLMLFPNSRGFKAEANPQATLQPVAFAQLQVTVSVQVTVDRQCSRTVVVINSTVNTRLL